LTKEMFLNHLYGGMDEPELKIIDVFVCKLRKKLAQATGGSHYIETVWGRGYVLRDPVPLPGLPAAGASADISAARRSTAAAQLAGAATARLEPPSTQFFPRLPSPLSEFRAPYR